MRFRTKSGYWTVWALALVLALPIAASAQDKDNKDKHKKEITGTPVFWHEPTDIESRNLLLGAGGEEMKPDIRQITFIEQKKGGYSTKYRVRDAKGNEWIAKIGKEAQTDTAANRLLWALGYETEICYLYPHLTILGKGELDNVRLEARPANVKRTGPWSWEKNPFVNTPEFHGLKILMVMINNWDMKDTNNEILATRGDTTGEGELRYIISDLGGSFGKTGGIISRSRNKPSDYEKATFIEKVNGDVIDFHYSGKNKKLFDNLTVADARWLSNWLTRLSDEQIKDAFRAANYSPEEVDVLAAAFKERINDLANPAGSVAKDN
ncbi:MAG TPA: hypothetical protein VEV42_05225 [Pyrinomonadaceae bacterium]|nr:hypothetical protein [Pyrinomonadaceae bacterium]